MLDLFKYEHLNQSVFNQVRKNSDILDVGCWTGSLGKALIEEKNCRVDGIDHDIEALKVAKGLGYNKVYNIDLNNLKKLGIEQKTYDYIIFADILEHILFPQSVLAYYNDYLKEDGLVIICLPNIAFILYRIKLFFGIFNYKHVGVMDSTHVRFYTLKTMKELISEAGFSIINVVKHNEVAPRYFLLHFLKELIPNLFTLQFVFLLRKSKCQN